MVPGLRGVPLASVRHLRSSAPLRPRHACRCVAGPCFLHGLRCRPGPGPANSMQITRVPVSPATLFGPWELLPIGASCCLLDTIARTTFRRTVENRAPAPIEAHRPEPGLPHHSRDRSVAPKRQSVRSNAIVLVSTCDLRLARLMNLHNLRKRNDRPCVMSSDGGHFSSPLMEAAP